MDEGQFKYWAFISYSHYDQKPAAWLHRKLETYRVPNNLISIKARTGEMPKKLYPIFRDREELPTSADLGSNIRNALRQSRFLIVVCSLHSAESLWVNEEIKIFKEMGREDQILCLIVDGEPNVSDKQVIQNKECFAPALRYRVDTEGRLTNERSEPIAADIRPAKDGKRNALLKLLAGLLSVDYAILNDREKRRRIKNRLVFASITMVFVAAISASVYLLLEQEPTLPEWVPILTEPVVTNLETPTVTSTYSSGTQPIINGEIVPSEWPLQPTFVNTLQYSLQGELKSGEMIGYVTNNTDYLFIAIQVIAEGFDDRSLNEEGVFLSPSIWFDGDNDGVISIDEDVQRYWKSNYVDSHLGVEGWADGDINQRDGIGAYTFSDENATYTYEFQIPLDSGDTQDLAVSPGETIGIKVVLFERQHFGSSDSTKLATAGWPTGQSTLDANTYAKLILAKPDTAVKPEPITPAIPCSPEINSDFENRWSDDFNDISSGWPITLNTPFKKAGYQESRYFVFFEEPKRGHPVFNDALEEYSDFLLSVDCWLESEDSHGSYGVIFHASYEKRGEYRFMVSTDGRYHLTKIIGGNHISLADTESPSVKTGSQINRLTINCIGPQIEAYINGSLVASIVDDSIKEGLVGLMAANDSDDAGVCILFDNFYLAW